MAENFNLTNVNNMGSDFGSETTYSTKIPAFKIMENSDYWKAYYENVGINTDKYSNLHELEIDSNNIYYKFTEAVKKDPNEFKKYLGALYKATSNDKTRPIWDKYGKYDLESETYTVNEDQKKEFSEWYGENRTDQKFGYFHLTPGITSGGTDPGNPKNLGDPNNPNDSNDPKNPSDPGNPTDLGNPYKIIPLLEKLKDRKEIKPWLTPIIAGHANDLITAKRVAEEKKKGITIPKKAAPYKHAIVTNDYFTRSQMEKEAKKLEWLAANSGIADEKTRDKYREAYLQQANKIRNEALSLKEQTFNKTTKEVNDAANYNREIAIEVYNKNKSKIDAAKQLLANINAYKALREGATKSKFITEAANEIRKAEYINKLDKASRVRQSNINELLLQLDKLIDEYSTVYKQSIWEDSDFINTINTILQDDTHQQALVGKNSQEDIKSYVEGIRNNDNNISNAYNTYEKNKENLLKSLAAQINKLKSKMSIIALELTYVSNTPEIVEDMYDYIKKGFHKTGGSVTKAQIQANQSRDNAILRSLDKFHERLYKQQRDADKQTTERLNMAENNLDKALGRLSQEDMLLLKKLFS